MSIRAAHEWIAQAEEARARSSAAGQTFFELPQDRRDPSPAEELEARRERKAEQLRAWRRGRVGATAGPPD